MANNEYMNEYMKKRYKDRKSRYLKLLGGRCVSCGETNETILQFDHIDRKSKEYTIGDMMLWAESRIIAELKKCQILCSKCHIEKTIVDLGQVNARTTHGTISSYRYCKCPVCREFMSNYNRNKNNERKNRMQNQSLVKV